jgi:PHP family Zn ribbon phosphoesterase
VKEKGREKKDKEEIQVKIVKWIQTLAKMTQKVHDESILAYRGIGKISLCGGGGGGFGQTNRPPSAEWNKI